MNGHLEYSAIRRAERGSAYIIALLALFVLTVLGLALVVTTQNEVQIGANEQTINRVFYAADSGLGVGAAKTLVARDYSPQMVTIPEASPSGADNNIAEVVQVTALTPIGIARCNWCPANANGVPQFFKVNHVVNATADRYAWHGTGAPPANATKLGEKKLGVMFEFQPWPSPPTAAVSNDLNPNLANVLF
jgi:Tfp pilus assembly protein PilX